MNMMIFYKLLFVKNIVEFSKTIIASFQLNVCMYVCRYIDR